MPRGHGDLGSGLGSANDALDKLSQRLENVALAGIKAASAEQELQAANESLQNQISDLNGVIEDLERRIQASGNIELFEQLKAAARRATRDFESFIDSVGLSWNSISDRGDTAVSEIAEEIRSGAQTYMGAVRQVKRDFAGLMRDHASVGIEQSELQGVYTALGGLEDTVKTLSDKFTELAKNGAIAAQEMKGTSDSSITSSLRETSKFVKEMSDGASEAVVPITKLVEQLTSLSDAQPVALSNIATAFRSLSEVGTGSFEPKKVTQISALITELQRVAGAGFSGININLSGLSDARIDKRNIEKIRNLADILKDLKEPLEIMGKGFNFDGIKELFAADPSNGINNLKVSKASLNNLATYLPEIEKISVKKLQGVFGVDTSGINSLKVSKASITNVENLARAVEILKENNIDLTLKGDSTQELDKIIDRMQDVSQATETATSSVNDFEQAFFDVTNSKGLKGDVADALRTRAVPKEDIASIINALDAVDGKIENVKVNWKNYGDEGRHVTSVILSGLNETGGAFQRIVQFTRDVNEETDEVTWTAKLAQGAENFKMAADDAAASEEKLVEIDGRLADVIRAKRKAQEQYDAAVKEGVNSVELNAMGRLIDSYTVLEDTIKDGGVAQNDYAMFMSNASSKSRLLTDILREQTKAQKDLKVEMVDSKSAVLELQNAQLKIQGVIDKSVKNGVTEDNEALRALIDMRDLYSLLEDEISQVGMSQDSYDAILKDSNAEFQLYSKQLGFAVQLHKEEEIAARAAAKAEAELVNTVRARGTIKQMYGSVDTTITGAEAAGKAAGVSVDTAEMQELRTYRDLLVELENEFESLGLTQKEFNTITANLKAIFREPEAAVKKLTATMKENEAHIAKSTKLYGEIEDASKKYEKAASDNNSTVRDTYSEIQKLGFSLDDAAQNLRKGTITQEQYDAIVKQTSGSLEEYISTLNEAGYGVDKTTSKFASLAQQLTRFITPLYLARKAWQTIKEMANTVMELEDAFASLQIVTGATDDELDRFYETAVNIATNLGKSITDIASSIEVFSRLGYSLADATALAEQATVLSNVAKVTADEATTGLTSIIKGYNMHVDNAEHVADVLINIGQKYAVSAGELMEAYEKSGAALAATNTSFEKSAALIAAANSAVQNSSVVGKVLPIHTVMYV